MPRVGSSRMSTSGSGVHPLRQDDLLLVAAGELAVTAFTDGALMFMLFRNWLATVVSWRLLTKPQSASLPRAEPEMFRLMSSFRLRP